MGSNTGPRAILGVSCDFHDAAAALVVDGEIVAAVEEERFSRVKHDSSVPARAIASCLAIAGLGADDLETTVMYEKPLRVISRNLAARQARGPAALGAFVREFPVLLRSNLMIGHRLDTELRRLGATATVPVRYAEHHLSHAAAAFFPSPFDTAAVVTIDGVGEWSTATIGRGLDHRVEQLVEQRFPNSLGLLYSLATAWCGFRPNDGEYKLMGLAPFGEARFAAALEEVVTVHDDGSISVDPKTVGWWSKDPARLSRLCALLEGPPRTVDEPLDQRHADIARSVQELVEKAVLRMAGHAHALTGASNLCLAGGVALNAVANGRLLREGPFDDVWVQPAAGDAGSALGAALWYWYSELDNPRTVRTDGPVRDAMAGAQLGPRFGGDEIAAWLSSVGLVHERYADLELLDGEVARRLADGAVVGWFQGRMEFGPRALGNRSILADPRSSSIHRKLNEQVKGRESFRPFAPAVRWEDAPSWFELDRPAPYMTTVVSVADSRLIDPGPTAGSFEEQARVIRSQIPACTHVDGTARVQTVHREINPRFHRLLSAFADVTGCPVLLNTSFNVAGEPIVCTPEDALASARRAGLDLLVLEDCVIDLTSAGAEVGTDGAVASAGSRHA